MSFKVHDCVCWYAYSGKNKNLKQGEILSIVNPGDNPKAIYNLEDLQLYGKFMYYKGKPRPHQSYLVKSGDSVYWPVVSRIKEIVVAESGIEESKFTFPN